MSLLKYLACIDATAGPTYDMCGCSRCGWKGKAEDLETEQEQDGWENPPYTIHLCPVCEDGGCIDDYWKSEDNQEE